MDTTLVIVTVLSMGMASALSAIVWRMLRLERQRSNARVAALAALAAEASAKDRPVDTEVEYDPPVREEPLRSSTAPAMFVETERHSPWSVRFAVMAAMALVVASIVLFSLALRAPRAGTKSAGAAATTGLELLSLNDARQADSLTISGLVQNPRTGAPLSRVAVTAYTFDGTGSFLGSGRALIDVTALAPGAESPFTVTVPAGNTVARYRIGFRDEAGRVIAHVDRRQPGPVASNWQRP
jgi:hypothetical protein